jgi:hypothetical protein
MHFHVLLGLYAECRREADDRKSGGKKMGQNLVRIVHGDSPFREGVSIERLHLQMRGCREKRAIVARLFFFPIYLQALRSQLAIQVNARQCPVSLY